MEAISINCKGNNQGSKNVAQSVEASLRGLFSQPASISKDWKSCNWQALDNWMGEFDLNHLIAVKGHFFILPPDAEDKKIYFEMILALIFTEYYRCSQRLLKSNDFNRTDLNFK